MHLLRRAALLTLIPLAIMTGIGASLLAQGKTADGRSTIAVGVIVAATMGASVLYQVERWTLKKQSLVHLFAMVVTVLPALFFSGWFDVSTAAGILAVLGIFLATGLVLWTIFYAVFTLVERRRGALPQ